MKKMVLIKSTLILLVVNNCLASQFQDIGQGSCNVKSVIVDNQGKKFLCFASDKGVFVSFDNGASWKNTLSKSSAKSVNNLIFSQNKEVIFACTEKGLFRSKDSAASWQRIYKARNYLENNCVSASGFKNTILVGTESGLFVSSDNGQSWIREKGKLGEAQVYSIAIKINKDKAAFFIASSCGIYLKEIQNESKRIFILNSVSSELINTSEEEYFAEGEKQVFMNLIYDKSEDSLLLASKKGVYKSSDNALTWVRLSDFGVLGGHIKYLGISPNNKIYGCAESGIFEFVKDRWYELSNLPWLKSCNQIAFANSKELFLASENGLFKVILDESKEHNNYDYGLSDMHEIPIQDVQKAAIDYAEVNPEKIQQWRKQASKKAIFPKVSASVNRDTSELWHWESGSSTKTFDDVLVPGNDAIGWDITLSWDLGEIIWNNDQTTIDARSRLLVELRNDIIDEVTKMYFERLRLKNELDNLNIEEIKKRFDKELRLAEITASIDAYTGGYFSREIKRKSSLQ